MTLSPKALEAAEDTLWYRTETGGRADLAGAIDTFLSHPDSGYVPRSHKRPSPVLQETMDQRDEARRERDIASKDFHALFHEAVKMKTQVAALREVLNPLAEIPIGAEIEEDRDLVLYKNAGRAITVGDVLDARAALGPMTPRRGFVGSRREELGPIDPALHSKPNECKALTDTAAAAAQYKRVPEGLSVNVAHDGTWLTFKARNGKTASLRVESLALDHQYTQEENATTGYTVIGTALKSWCDDLQIDRRATAPKAGEPEGL